MQIHSYISDLLYRYECVTIPNFGAFLTQRVSASISEAQQTFNPPKKLLSFNEQIKTNDGLLARYISDVEKIPFETALEKIATKVKVFKSKLTEGETLEFENIGSLLLNTNGKIEFEPSYHLNYLTDAFGLAQFNSPAVTREVYKDTVEAIEEKAPITITPERRKTRPYLKYVAVGLITLTLGGVIFNNYTNTVETHNQIAQEEANKQLEQQIQEATFIIDTPLPKITLNVEKQSGKYHLIAGAFRLKENSIKKVNQLKAKGFDARTIGVNKFGLHQVVYSSFNDRLEALKALRNVKRNHNSEAWLLVKDLN